LIRPLNIAVFGSGRGSNFSAILAAIERGEIPEARISVVICNNATAGILDIARAHDIAAERVSEKQFATHDEFVNALLAILRTHKVNLIALAGYMKRVPPQLIEQYRNRIVNIHPALLPKFGGQGMYGAHVHEAVIAAHEEFSGATVHVVDEEYDHGQILLQRKVSVAQHETPESLAEKVLKIEHEIYPEALKMIAEGKLLSTQHL
jgi:formyltetrahydrofolate-dependent phosphoribosylglycinamide formyltransferase